MILTRFQICPAVPRRWSRVVESMVGDTGRGTRIVLASASQRRIDLLSGLGIMTEVVPADVDETHMPGESPHDYVMRVALDKAHAVIDSTSGAVVIAADTSVVVDGRILGKPVDTTDAMQTIRGLSGRTHQVLTAVVVIDADRIEHSVIASTEVTFAELTDDEIEWYVATGEPFGKAGAYAIQGIGGFLVESIDGDPSTVIGLPLRATVELLRGAGVRFPNDG